MLFDTIDYIPTVFCPVWFLNKKPVLPEAAPAVFHVRESDDEFFKILFLDLLDEFFFDVLLIDDDLFLFGIRQAE